MGLAKELVAPIDSTPQRRGAGLVRNKVAVDDATDISSRLALDLGLVVQDRVQQ